MTGALAVLPAAAGPDLVHSRSASCGSVCGVQQRWGTGNPGAEMDSKQSAGDHPGSQVWRAAQAVLQTYQLTGGSGSMSRVQVRLAPAASHMPAVGRHPCHTQAAQDALQAAHLVQECENVYITGRDMLTQLRAPHQCLQTWSDLL